ncbi:Reverse transcriptase, RNA-dependent DNA polymerase [Dillenia turbinata]|uniref:Reverse transcriptase, RNA-dependent DNA polymerase n=1 Tax=Dillenia turbinata TaxID=194707 RepID=A0AAN8VJN8_9MAGN
MVVFTHDCFTIRDLMSMRMIGKGENKDDLYILDTRIWNQGPKVYVNVVTAHIWHNRLGHPSSRRLHVLKDLLKVTRSGCGSSFMELLVYVVDIIIMGPSLEAINSFKKFLSTHFKLKDLGKLKYFLVLKIARSVKGIVFCQ